MIGLACAMVLAAAPAPAPGGPALTETDLPRFRLLATPGAASAARRLAARLEAERDRLTVRLSGDYPGTTEVRLGADAAEAAQLASPDALVLDASSLERSPSALRHALVHHALARLGGPALPRWLTEGLASTLADENGTGAELALLRAGGTPMPLAQLEREFPEGMAESALAYAASASFAAHLLRLGGPAGLRMLLSATAGGEPFESAFAAAYGPRAEVEAAWRDRLHLRYAWVPRVTGVGALLVALALLAIALAGRARRQRQQRQAEAALDVQAAAAGARIAAAERRSPPASEPPAPPTSVSKPTLH